jgi:hypothetical protein
MKKIQPPQNESAPSSKELETLEQRFEEFSALSGEWLLLQEDQLLAHSRDYREINAEIRKRGLKDCFVYYVPTAAEHDFILV